ncbi:MAG: hypothetical protein ABW215_03350, partial [Kibdelosporangium sp.]
SSSSGQERTPINPGEYLHVPAGMLPVDVGITVAGVTPRSSSEFQTRYESRQSTTASDHVVLTRSEHDVRFQITFSRHPGAGPSTAGPAARTETATLRMALEWEKPGRTSSDRRPSSPGLDLGYPDIAGKGPLERLRELRNVEKGLKRIRLVDFSTGLADRPRSRGRAGMPGAVDVVSRIQRHYRLDEEQTESVRAWLDGLDHDERVGIITGRRPARRKFPFKGKDEPVEIVVARLKPEKRAGGQTEFRRATKTTIEKRNVTIHQHTLSESGTREIGVELSVATGEGYSEALGATLGADISFMARSQNKTAVSQEHLRESAQRTMGDFETHVMTFDFLVSLGESGRRVREVTDSEGRRVKRSVAVAYTVTVPGEAELRVVPPEEVDIDAEYEQAIEDELELDTRGPAGMPIAAVPQHVHGQWRLSDETMAELSGAAMHWLAQDLVTPEDLHETQHNLERFLNDNTKDILDGGDGATMQFELPNGKRLFFSGAVNADQGEHIDTVESTELADRWAVSMTSAVDTTRSRSALLHFTAEASAGPVSIEGKAGPVVRKLRREDISQTFQEIHSWTGTSAVYLHAFPVQITVRLGADWGDLDEPVKWAEATAYDDELAVSGSSIKGKVEIAVGKRPGRGIVPDLRPGLPGVETGWLAPADAADRIKPMARPAKLPVHDLELVAAVRHLGSTAREMLKTQVQSRKNFKEAAKWLASGSMPIQLGADHEDPDGDASRDQLERWASWSTRRNNVAAAVHTSDMLRLATYNEPGLLQGTRYLVGWADLKTELGNPRIIDRDDNHVFRDSVRTVTNLPTERKKTYGADASVAVSGGPEEIGELEGEASMAYERGHARSTAETVTATTTQEWRERGYLVEYDARHDLATLVREQWTDPLGGLHTNPSTTDTKAKFVPRALQVWVAASKLSMVGELTEHDVANNLAPEDRAAYHRARPSAAPPEQAKPPAGDGPGRPKDVPLVVGVLGPMRPEVVLELTTKVRALLRQYEENLYAGKDKKDKDAVKVRAAFAQLHDFAVQKFSEALVTGGFDALVGDAVMGGIPLFVDQVAGNGKLEQLILVKGRLLEGEQAHIEPDYRYSSEVTVSGSVGEGTVSALTTGLTAKAKPAVPKPEVPAGIAETARDKLMADALSPEVGGELTRTRTPLPTLRKQYTSTFVWSGDADRHGLGIEVAVEVFPLKRHGDYLKHFLRSTEIKGMHSIGDFTLDDALESTVPSFFADLAKAIPIREESGSLRELIAKQGYHDLRPDAIMHVWRFPAPKLHEVLGRLLEPVREAAKPPARLPHRSGQPDGLNPRRAVKVLVSGGAVHLAHHFREGLSRAGYPVSVDSKTVSTVTVKFDLLGRKLLGPIPGGTLSAAMVFSDETADTVVSGRSLAASLLGGLANTLLGEPKVERQSEKQKEVVRDEDQPRTHEFGPNRAYLVRARLSWAVVVAYKNGKSETIRPSSVKNPDGTEDNRDGDVWLALDDAGLRAFGLWPDLPALRLEAH